jgi:hypothetical protein
MDEKPDQIMNHIDTQRQELGRNLNELETRVKGATDWRVQFDKNPMLMMGVALGGGLLLGTMVGGRRSSNRSSYGSSSRNYTSSTMRSAGTGAAAYGLSSSGSGTGSGGSTSSSSTSSPALREQRRKATDTLEHMKAALVGFAIAKVKEFMTEALPGFDHHLSEAERKNSQHQSSSKGNSVYGSGTGSGYGHEQSGGYGSSGSQGSGSQSGGMYGGTGGQASTRGGESGHGQQGGQRDQQYQPVGANPGLNI